ncbi:hypothetical protein [Deinococcus ruber]|uniref:Lipoprotein n=1 Tax=Deinococcus ruber TaxID=1848197 RepID=A0A918FC23_9DEIO|nr:hypothetical protein [Deinococcus ruber]GGR29380.1 hypothetical protein GCM10008957_45510 [Deinococcus ruber]
MKQVALLTLMTALSLCACSSTVTPQVLSSADAVKHLVVLTTPGAAGCPVVSSHVTLTSTGSAATVKSVPGCSDVTVSQAPSVTLQVGCADAAGQPLGQGSITWNFDTLPTRVSVGAPGPSNLTLPESSGLLPSVNSQ